MPRSAGYVRELALGFLDAVLPECRQATLDRRAETRRFDTLGDGDELYVRRIATRALGGGFYSGEYPFSSGGEILSQLAVSAQEGRDVEILDLVLRPATWIRPNVAVVSRLDQRG
jgi:hypothetical protein